MNNYEALASNLKALRNREGITQTAIARILDVNKTTVMRWEAGISIPDIKTIMWYADHFDVSLDWIMGRKMTIRGDFRKLVADEVGDAISSVIKPGGKVYDKLFEEIGVMLDIYSGEEG